ncbi:UDP-glycosyltransferase [Nymphaea thermarum]|nr:UDP-glycosyltransferase [Nymphaea thermarum]
MLFGSFVLLHQLGYLPVKGNLLCSSNPSFFVLNLARPLCATCSSSNPGTMFQQDRMCLTWLDRHAHGSVIYISIGSATMMGPAELAQGLGDCQHPFLWVIGPGSVKAKESVRFLDRFGSMVKWAPQTEVLVHPAVSAFMLHCGWNSTLESTCAGKPMLCWPAFGDKKVKDRMIWHVWGKGMGTGERLET